MFGGDPFGNTFNQMRRQMQDMDNMMNSMMGDMFGMHSGFMGRPRQQAIGHNNMMMSPFAAFNSNPFGSLMRSMEHNVNDPNSMFMSQSTMITYDGNGAPKVVQSSLRKAGDVQETRRTIQNGEKAKMTVGHTIGNRSHIIEKKRDKDGRVRQQQKFVNLDSEKAEEFNNEFKSRATQNLQNFGVIPGNNAGNSRKAIENGSGQNRLTNVKNKNTGPIVTVPDDEDDDDEIQYMGKTGYAYFFFIMNFFRRSRNMYDSDDEDEIVVPSNSRNGPTIQEITDEEAESPKRRRGLGKFFGRH